MKIIIGVKYCGHCNPMIYGPEIIENVKKVDSNFDFVSWQEQEKDILLIVSACSSGCADRPHFKGPVIEVAGSSVDRINYPLRELPVKVLEKIKEKGAAVFD